jgi:hypothetical protein
MSFASQMPQLSSFTSGHFRNHKRNYESAKIGLDKPALLISRTNYSSPKSSGVRCHPPVSPPADVTVLLQHRSDSLLLGPSRGSRCTALMRVALCGLQKLRPPLSADSLELLKLRGRQDRFHLRVRGVLYGVEPF